MSYDDEECVRPPHGWKCSRGNGHLGPCAARPVEDDDLIERCARAAREAYGNWLGGWDDDVACPEYKRDDWRNVARAVLSEAAAQPQAPITAEDGGIPPGHYLVADADGERLVPKPSGPEYAVDYGYLCQVVDHCTCGAGRGGYYGAHEQGCGLEPVAPVDQLITPITAEDVRAAEAAWLDGSRDDEAARMNWAAFVADYLNRRGERP